MSQGDTDGIDSNGDLYINGGTVDVTAQFPFDYDGTAEHNGGTIIVNGEETDEITNQFGGGGPGGFGGGGFGGNGGNPGNFPGRGGMPENGDRPEDQNGPDDGNFPGDLPDDFSGEFPGGFGDFPNDLPDDFSGDFPGNGGAADDSPKGDLT